MTQEQTCRTIEALAETNRLLEKEQRYLPHLQKLDYLASLERHATKLIAMLEQSGFRRFTPHKREG